MGFYDLFVTFVKTDGTQSYALCPMHHDVNPSFTVNTDTDEWYCHGCGTGGKYAEFIERYYDVGRDVAIKAAKMWEKSQKLPFPTETYVDECVKKLQSKPAELAVLKSFGMTDEVITKYKLGLDDIRITIPVYSKTGRLINVRKYLPPHRRIDGSNNAKVIGVAGCNESRFFPYDNLNADKDTVYIVEGEKDCLVAISQGFNCVTGTGGTSLPEHEEALFKDKNVILMGDTDAPGMKVQERYALMLYKVAKSIKQIILPRKDFTEYWMATKSPDVAQYMRDAVIPNEKEEFAIKDAMSLARSEFVENLNTWTTLENMSVIGADPKVYTIPKSLRIKCTNKACTKPCPLATQSIGEEVDIDPRQLIQFIDSSDELQDKYTRKLAMCKHVVSEPVAMINVQRIIFQETASFMEGLEEASFEPRYGIVLYDENRLMPTAKYNFEACRVTDPRNQQNYYVIRKVTPVQTSVDKCDEDTISYFKSCAHECKTASDLINLHYDKWKSALGIEGRPDLFGAILLTYASVTEISWNNGTLKGWLDTMIIGDTRTGKSQMAQRFIKTIKMGSYINGENARRTGVIGGVQRSGDSWIVTWGAIPMNDKGLLVIDEAGGLDVEDIKELSATRSSGAVTINKIAKGEARARTRLLWLSNPRSGRNIEDFYWKGYGAFMEFIPVVEDQARYDIVISAARADVDKLVGNVDPITVDESMYSKLFNFAWTIDANNIIIRDDTAAAIKQSVLELSKVYEGGPLIISVSAHEKMLRVACAFAIITGSVDKDKLLVEPYHVEYAKQFINMTLSKPTFDYSSFIAESRRAYNERAANTQYVRGLVATYPAIKVLLSAQRFKGSQISEILGVDRGEAAKILSELLRRGLMKISANGSYQSDKLLIDIARQMEV